MSSNHATNHADLLPSAGRLHNKFFWIAPVVAKHYLEIQLLHLRRITHVATQGGYTGQTVEQFYIRLNDPGGVWVDYTENGKTKVFDGNNGDVNTWEVVSNCLKESFPAKGIRIQPTVCAKFCSLKLELYSCENSCSAPLGIETGRHELVASSWLSNKEANKGRLRGVPSWCAEGTRPVEYLQVNLIEYYFVTAVATQGWADPGSTCFARTYSIMYRDADEKWVTYKGYGDTIFHGNINAETVVYNKIGTPFLTRQIRFVVKSTPENCICLRVEVYGCVQDNPSFSVETNSTIAGKELLVKGKYRYCEDSACPGCKKSLCIRIFDNVHHVASRLRYDCLYHHFQIAVQAPVVPGLYKIYMADTDRGNCTINPDSLEEHLAGSVTVGGNVSSPEREIPFGNCLALLLSGWSKSGVYTIDPDGNGPIDVYCDQDSFGGGWTVLLRRVDDATNFNRDWDTYKKGFGDLEKNIWLGNDYIHRLTENVQELLFDAESMSGDNGYTLYKTFQVDNESNKYRLSVGGYVTSAMKDSMTYSNDRYFTTKDRDNDDIGSNCAVLKQGGWWYKACAQARPTGTYNVSYSGARMSWNKWNSGGKLLSKVQMAIRDKNVTTCSDQYCYYLTSSKKSWPEAVEQCRKFNADLVSIHNEMENDWVVTNILTTQSLDEVHLGLGMEHISRWTDGSHLELNKLTASITTSECAFLKLSGSWEAGNCDDKKTVLCKRGKFCFKGDCYVFGKSTVEFNSARSYCQGIGYDLVKISNIPENKYLQQLGRAMTDDSSFVDAFIGLKFVSPKYQWLDGTMLQYNAWKSGEPNQESCSVLAVDGWYDTSCTLAMLPLCEKGPTFKNCDEVKEYGRMESGYYSMLTANGGDPFLVFCDLRSDDGQWTVIQRRTVGAVQAGYEMKTWNEYRDGFGRNEMSFWLGNKHIHELTKTPQKLKITLHTNEFQTFVAYYEDFTVKDEASGFAIDFGAHWGTAGDSLAMHRGMKFSTADRDNDLDGGACTSSHPGGWWFAGCLDSNLNGLFNTETNSEDTLFWRTVMKPIVKTEMKIQPYKKGFQSDGIVYGTTGSLGLNFDINSMDIIVKTSSEQWTTRVLHPGPFMTHVAVTWSEISYLRYYENGTLLAEVPSLINSRKKYPANSSMLIISKPEIIALNQLTLWRKALTEFTAKSQYKTRNFTFEDDVHLWKWNNTAFYSWGVEKTCTPSEHTGPCADHTYMKKIGHFMFTEASKPAAPYDKAILESPRLPALYNCLSFWYHMFGEEPGSLNIYLSTNTSVAGNIKVWNISGDQGNQWRYMEVEVNVASVFKIVIEAVRGEGFLGDISVDDISLTEEKCENVCKPPCGHDEKCIRSSLRCVYVGTDDHHWTMDSLDVIDEKDLSECHSKIGNLVLIDGVVDKALELNGDARVIFKHIWKDCEYEWCFPMYTISMWIKYKATQATGSHTLFQFGSLIFISQNPVFGENRIRIWVHTALQVCHFLIFLPSDVWAHIVISVKAQSISMHVDGHKVTTPTIITCSPRNAPVTVNQIYIIAGTRENTVNIALDDLRLSYDALDVTDAKRSYQLITGERKQSVFIQVKLTSEVWNDDLLKDDSEAFKSMSELIRRKIMATLKDRSSIKDVVVERFIKGSVIVDVNLVYQDVSYQDILLVEEALYVNKTFDGLVVDVISLNSSSIPQFSPSISAYPVNSTSLSLNWTKVDSLDLNGIFQGYKVLYRKTESPTYSEYKALTFYGNHTETNLTGLSPVSNYTIRVLAFTLSGDGFLSPIMTVFTLEGEVDDSPVISVANLSSTVLRASWTMLPNSTEIYAKLLGYYVFYWKASNASNVLNVTVFGDGTNLENLEKWTVYCVNVSGYTSASIGPGSSQTQCIRTFEDAPEEEPINITIVDVTAFSMKVHWSPPPASSVPGIIRYYNLTYRVLNYSDFEIVSRSFPSNVTSHVLEGLTGHALCEINITAFTVRSGPVSTTLAFTAEGVPLAAPTNISWLSVSSTAINMNWTSIPKLLHNGLVIGYRVFIWKQSEGNESSYNTTVSSKMFFKRLDGLKKWTFYCGQVAGFTRIGIGPRSMVQCTRTFEDAPELPPSITVVGTTWSTIEIQWSPPPSYAIPGIIRHYNLTSRNLNYTDENSIARAFDSTVTSYRLENLIGLTLYEINITSFTVNPGPWNNMLVMTKEGVPGVPPINVSWLNMSSTSLKMNWSAIPIHLHNGITLGYRLYIWKQSEGDESSFNTTVPALSLDKTVDGLEKWTWYCAQIVGFTRIGEGVRSSVECSRTYEDAPEMHPTHLNVSNITWSAFNLSWDSINSSFIPGILRSYRVTYRIIDTHPAFDRSNHSFLVDSRFTATPVTGLQGFTNYEVIVAGVTVKDGPVDVTYMKTDEGVPTLPPPAFNTSTETSTTISLVWQEIPATDKHGIIRGHELTYEEEGTVNKTKSITLSPDALAMFLIQLVPFSYYKMTLCGFTSKGKGVKSHVRTQTAEGAPKIAPKNFFGTNFTGPTTIYFGWNSLTTRELQGNLKGYQIKYREFSVADEELLNPPKEIRKNVYSNINGFSLTGLETYTTYTVSVAAISDGGVGVFSKTLYIATCRCFKTLSTNYWNYQPYTNISTSKPNGGFFPYLLDMVTLSCCQTCLEHGTSEIDYFTDGEGNAGEKLSDIAVKNSLTLKTDFSFPMFGYKGQTAYSKYYGFAAIMETVGTVFFTLKPDYGSQQSDALVQSIMSCVPLLAIAVLMATIAGIIMWALENRSNQDEFPPSFFKGAANGFWWALITMTTVGYGDKTARTTTGRIFAVIWILVGLVISSLLIGTIASAFTTSTSLDVQDTILYGAQISALHDSPDHRLGVRRNAKVNTYGKYSSLEEIQKVLLNGEVNGILVDSYVADSRKDLFGHSKLVLKKVIDLSSSYGVIMGKDGKKLQKCFVKFWKENAATRTQYIKDNTNPVTPDEVKTEEIVGETFNPQGKRYKISLLVCLILLAVFTFCGSIYEIIRRKKISLKVEPINFPQCQPSVYRNLDDPLRDLRKERSGPIVLCDRNLTRAWYRFTLQGEPAELPRSCPEMNKCGSSSTIWLPEADVIKIGKQVEIKACATWTVEQNHICCFWKLSIFVRHCGDFEVYRLRRTDACPTSYCSNVTKGHCGFGKIGYKPNCRDSHPKLPKTLHFYPFFAYQDEPRKPYLYLRCLLDYRTARSENIKYLFTISKIERKQDGTFVKHAIRSLETSRNYCDMLLMPTRYRDVGLGDTVVCETRSFFRSSNDIKSPPLSSKTYHLGIEVHPSTAVVLAQSQSVNITFTLTLPVICPKQNSNCSLVIPLVASLTDVSRGDEIQSLSSYFTLSKCSLVFKPKLCSRQKIICGKETLQLTAGKNFRNTDVRLRIKLGPISSSDAVWKKKDFPVVDAILKPTSRFSCYAMSTSNIKTFGGSFFKHLGEGTFLFHRGISSSLEVQLRKWRCDSISTCACAVAVREGDDVIIADICGGQYRKTSLRIVVRSKLPLHHKTRIVESNDGKTFSIHFPSGSHISIDEFGWGINVYLTTLELGDSRGLCRGSNSHSANHEKLDRKFSQTSLIRKIYNHDSLFEGSILPLKSPPNTNKELCGCSDLKNRNRSRTFCQPSSIGVDDGSNDITQKIVDNQNVLLRAPSFIVSRSRHSHVEALQSDGPALSSSYKRREVCEAILNGTDAALVCKDVIREELWKNMWQMCLQDTQEGLHYNLLESNGKAITRLCEEELDQRVDRKSLMRRWKEKLCENRCSRNGKCQNGNCKCNVGK